MLKLKIMWINFFFVKNLNLSQSLKPYSKFVNFLINADVFTYLTLIQTRFLISLLNNITSVVTEYDFVYIVVLCYILLL